MSKKTTNHNASNHGGARAGAGRPKGSGKYKEPTKAIRVPEGSIRYIKEFLGHYPDVTEFSLPSATSTSQDIGQTSSLKNDHTDVANISDLMAHRNRKENDDQASSSTSIPFISSLVAAGYPTAADEHVDDNINLNDYMIRKPDSTYMVRVEGESMKDAGILEGDILIVDRALKAKHNKIVIAALDGELTVKRLFQQDGITKLVPENLDYPDIEIESEAELVIWGVVIGSFRRFQTF